MVPLEELVRRLQADLDEVHVYMYNMYKLS